MTATKKLKKESFDESVEVVNDSVQTDTVLNEELSDSELLESLINKRLNSHYPIVFKPTDLKYLKNLISEKFEWEGPDQAYLLLISDLYLDQLVKSSDLKKDEATKYEFSSQVLESINFILKRIKGTGKYSANRLFSISMILRKVINEINLLDSEIAELRKKLENTESV
jgi:hypothetical protein